VDNLCAVGQEANIGGDDVYSIIASTRGRILAAIALVLTLLKVLGQSLTTIRAARQSLTLDDESTATVMDVTYVVSSTVDAPDADQDDGIGASAINGRTSRATNCVTSSGAKDCSTEGFSARSWLNSAYAAIQSAIAQASDWACSSVSKRPSASDSLNTE